MSVISRMTVTPNRLEIVYRYLRAERTEGLSPAELLANVAPPPLQSRQAARADAVDPNDNAGGPSGRASGGQREPTGTAPEVLAEARQLGIAEDAGDGAVRLGASLRATAPASLLDYLDGILTNPERAAAAGQSEFPRALAWFLSKDPEQPLPLSGNYRDEVPELTNKDRFNQFVYWVRYLGYGWRLGAEDGKEVAVPDPTRALERLLPRVLEAAGELPMPSLGDAWGALCPVLEGGAARRAAGAGLQPSELSRSTSLALVRLEERAFLRLERRADAPVVTLAAWPAPRPVSHIVLQRPK